MLKMNLQLDEFEENIDEVLSTFMLSADERNFTLSQLPMEVKSRFAAFVKIATLCALLPVIEGKARRYFQAQSVPLLDAEDLGGAVIAKVMSSLFGGWPRANAGAWIAQIRYNLFADYQRDIERVERQFGWRQPATVLNGIADASQELEALNLFVSELPALLRAIIERRREGESWPSIADALGITESEALELIQGVEWPGGSRGSPKRRRSNRSSRR